MSGILPLNTFFAVLGLILGFGLIIFVHELGHFLVAKAVGIKCLQFAVGMGHALVSYRRGLGVRIGSTQAEFEKRLKEGADEASMGETEYRICWLPIGGYVKMLGQDDMNPTAGNDDPRSFTSKPIWARACVISAGVVMNIIFAVFFFVIAFMAGVRFPPAIVGGVDATMPAGQTFAQGHGTDESFRGLQVGDVITHIDSEPIDDFMQVSIRTALAAPGEALSVTVKRDGITPPLVYTMEPVPSPATNLLALGIAPPSSLSFAITPMRGPLADAGVEADMSIVDVDGREVSGYGQVYRAMVAAKGQPVVVTVADATSGRRVEARVRAVPGLTVLDDEGNALNPLGFVPAVVIGSVLAESPAEDAGFEPGDIVASFDGISWPTADELQKAVRQSSGRKMRATVRRGDQTVTLEGIQANDANIIGVGMEVLFDEPIVAGALADRPAAALDLAKGSRLTAVAGVAIEDWYGLQRVLETVVAETEDGVAATLTVGYELNVRDRPRGEGTVTLAAGDVVALQAARWSDPLGRYLDILREPVVAATPVAALGVGFDKTQQFMLQTYVTLARLFQGTVRPSHLRGPVGIVDEGTRVARQGWTYLLFFLGLISVNLAVINFLPIPIVDGGLMVFLIVEKLKGSPVNPRIQTAATVVGLALIASIFLMTLYFDIGRIMGRG